MTTVAAATAEGARTTLGEADIEALLQGRTGERRLVVSWRRHRGRELGAGPPTRQPEVPEDPLSDGGVVDRGDQLHASCTESQL